MMGLSNTKAARIYARFSIYLMPLITALRIFLILTSLIVASSNSGARAGQRDLGPQSNLLIPGLLQKSYSGYLGHYSFLLSSRGNNMMKLSNGPLCISVLSPHT